MYVYEHRQEMEDRPRTSNSKSQSQRARDEGGLPYLMPNIWAHLIFGQEVLKGTGYGKWLENRESRNIFHLGCQGPDPLFYHRFLPWHNDKRMNRLGSAMHEEHCGGFLRTLFRHLRGGGEGEPAVIFAAGFLLHHILDRNAHPYIFAKSGFVKWKHQRFEIILDTIVAARLRGIETWKTAVWRELEVEGGLPGQAARLMDALCSEFYPELYEGLGTADWYRAYRDFAAAQKLFHDPAGVKRVLTLGRIEPFVYKRNNAPLDYCNEAKASWYDPCDGKTAYDTGFWEHWEAALQEARELLPLVMRMVRSGEAPSLLDTEEERELARRLGNISYSTGRECGRYEIRFADPMI